MSAPPQATLDDLVARIFDASLGMLDVMAVCLGDRLGLYAALREGGPRRRPLSSRPGQGSTCGTHVSGSSSNR